MLGWFRSQQNITKMIYWVVAIIFVGGAFAGFGGSLGGGGCSGGRGSLTPQQKEYFAETVAKVGDQTINRREFLDRFSRYSDRDKQAKEQGIYVPPPEDVYVRQWDTLNGMVMQLMIEQEAVVRAITVEQKDIDDQIAQIKQQLQISKVKAGKKSLFERIGDLLTTAKEDKNFRAKLMEVAQITPDQLKNEIRLQMLAAKFGQKLREEINTELDNEAKAKADEVVGKINAAQDFVKLVEEYSDDTATKKNGGLVENVTRDSQQPQEIKDNAFSLAVGETSPPFKVHEEMDNPYGGGREEKMVFEYYIILKVTDKLVATGPDFEAKKEKIREELRKKKWEAEKKANPDALLEDIDVSDEDITANYEKVSFNMIKIESMDPSMINDRTEKKVTEIKNKYAIEVYDPEMSTWKKVEDQDYAGARDDWSLVLAETESKMNASDISDSGVGTTEDQLAVQNYVYGLLYRIQIDGYSSQQIYVTGEKNKRAKERWEEWNKDPEAYAADYSSTLQEPTEEEKAEYKALDEEALPYFNKALDVIKEDGYIYILGAETLSELERYDEAYDDFKAALDLVSDDLQLNRRLSSGLNKIMGFITDPVKAADAQAVYSQLNEKVQRLTAEMQKLQQQMQAQQQAQQQPQQQAPPQGAPQGTPRGGGQGQPQGGTPPPAPAPAPAPAPQTGG